MALMPIDVKALSKMDVKELLVVQLIATNELLSSELVVLVIILENNQWEKVES